MIRVGGKFCFGRLGRGVIVCFLCGFFCGDWNIRRDVIRGIDSRRRVFRVGLVREGFLEGTRFGVWFWKMGDIRW